MQISPQARPHTAEVALLVRIAERDAVALGALFDLWAPRLGGYLRRMLGNPSDADDALQEAFASLWRHAPRFDPARHDPALWILQQARWRALDVMRSRKPAVASLQSEESCGDDTDPTTARVELEDHAVAVRTALRRLPEEQSVLLELSFYRGFSHGEIARRTGQPVGTVKSRIRRAMLRMRDLLVHLKESA